MKSHNPYGRLFWMAALSFAAMERGDLGGKRACHGRFLGLYPAASRSFGPAIFEVHDPASCGSGAHV